MRPSTSGTTPGTNRPTTALEMTRAMGPSDMRGLRPSRLHQKRRLQCPPKTNAIGDRSGKQRARDRSDAEDRPIKIRPCRARVPPARNEVDERVIQ